MLVDKCDLTLAKGWLFGPWNSDLDVSVGFANQGVDEPHWHRCITEIYLIARGRAEMRVETETVVLNAGDLVVIGPGEAHTFLASSPDYFHFVIHTPGLRGREARTDKVLVPRSRLGLE